MAKPTCAAGISCHSRTRLAGPNDLYPNQFRKPNTLSMKEAQKLSEVYTWGLRFTNAEHIEHVSDALLQGYRGKPGQLPLVVTPNVDILVTLEEASSHVSETVDRAAILLADGQPLVSLSRLAGDRLSVRLAGSDLTSNMWPRLVAEGRKVFGVVSTAEVGIELARRHANFHWSEAPKLPEEEGSLIDRYAWHCINKMATSTAPEFIFVGVGFPKDILVARSIIDQWPEALGRPPMVLAVGASLEFLTGTKTRAPEIFQRFGVEFLYRMLSDPRRLVKRYVVRDSRFLLIVARHVVKAYR